MIKVWMACGCPPMTVKEDQANPRCGCGETRVQSVQSRPPRFTGTCTGPYAQTVNLSPGVTSVAPGGSLNLKPQE